MKVIGVIPARWGSTRLPGKSLIAICGKPLIQWVVEGALRARRLESLIVATDDPRIADAVKGLGVKAVMTKPEHPSGTDRIAEAIQDVDAEVIINIQGDEPMIDPTLIDRLADTMVNEPDWDMGTAAAPIPGEKDLTSSSVVKVVWGERHQALYFSRSMIPFVRDNDLADTEMPHWRHLGVYAYRRHFLEKLVRTPPCLLERSEKLEQLRALWLGARMVVLEASEAGIGVDTPEDVKLIERVMGSR